MTLDQILVVHCVIAPNPKPSKQVIDIRVARGHPRRSRGRKHPTPLAYTDILLVLVSFSKHVCLKPIECALLQEV